MDQLLFLVKHRVGDVREGGLLHKPALFLVPDPEVTVVRLVAHGVEIAKVPIAVKIGVHRLVRAKEAQLLDLPLDGPRRTLGVPDLKQAVPIISVLILLHRHQQGTQTAAGVHQEGVVGVVDGLLLQQLLGGFGGGLRRKGNGSVLPVPLAPGQQEGTQRQKQQPSPHWTPPS